MLTHEGEDGNTYSVDIFYEYEAGNELQRSNRYGFVGGSSSGRGAKANIAKSYPRGSTQTCLVNPDDPLEAVLKPELGSGVLLALIPLFFLLIGGGGLTAMLMSSSRSPKKAEGDWLSTLRSPSAEIDPVDALLFRPGKKRLVAFLVALGIALFWNGIVSVFVWQMVAGHRSGAPEWFLTLFMIPFVLIGIAMICAVFYTLGTVLNPKPELTLTPGSPALGDRLRVEWHLRGATRRLRNLRILLIAREKATYVRGTNTHTDREIFFSRLLGEASHGIDLVRGECQFDLPTDLCPTIKLGNNEVEWSLKVEGEIPRWPDIDDNHVITVRLANQ